MARKGTPLGNLGTYLDGENPGAGSQDVDNDGLNGDKIKLDTGVFTEHNTNGTHRDDKIEGRSIKDAYADGTTLEHSATTGAKTIRVKDLGISTAKLANDAVTAAKISHDNNRTKIVIPAQFAAVVGGTYITVAGILNTATQQIKLERAGCITAITAINSAGGVIRLTDGYDTGADNHFTAAQSITVLIDTAISGAGGQFSAYINGTQCTGLIASAISWTSNPVLVMIEIEFDD